MHRIRFLLFLLIPLLSRGSAPEPIALPEPLSPVAPIEPVAPAPVEPVTPVPVEPVAPVEPVTPVPVGPVAPVAVEPVVPTAPPSPAEPPALVESITLENEKGASIVFTLAEGMWRWTSLFTPEGPPDGWTISDRGVEINTSERQAETAAGWTLLEASPSRVILEQTLPALGLRLRRIYSFGPATNALRIETWVRTEEGSRHILRIGLLEARIRGELFRETGAAPASFPLFGRSLFAGIEHISGDCNAAGETVELYQRPRVTLGETWQFVAAAVVGWSLPGHGDGLPRGARVREAFLHYLDSVRIKPDRIVLHSETWWTMMPPLFEKDVLNDIEALRKGFHERTGMFFDTYCLDLGWSDPRTFWRIADERFPNQFRTINERLNGLGAKLGLWMSPGSGYPDGLNNGWLQSQGHEITPFPEFDPGVACFALGGRYQREFKERLLDYAQQYGLGHVILDFMAHECNVAAHGHPIGPESRVAIAAGLADVLDGLRAVNPRMALEPMVCGYPPSPWWLTKTPFVLGPAGDDVPFGRVPCPDWMESLISARDIAYRAGQEAWIMPTQALETWDLIVQTPGEFENTAVMAIGRGRWFISTYIKPDLMKPEDWDFFAALVRWARHNKEFLANAWMFGGRPEKREAYGYLFRNASKNVYCVRNPWIEERSIQLPNAAGVNERRDIRMIYPRRVTIARLEPGEAAPSIMVAPYETIMLETVPVDDTVPLRPTSSSFSKPSSTEPMQLFRKTAAASADNESEKMAFNWGGTISVPTGGTAELCILVEGTSEVARATCRLSIAGREVTPGHTGSAGQFGAAREASPDNWKWFIVPISAGSSPVQIELTVPADGAALGVYLRGFAPAENDSAPDNDTPVFPVFNSQRRPWSQTIAPLTAYPIEG